MSCVEVGESVSLFTGPDHRMACDSAVAGMWGVLRAVHRPNLRVAANCVPLSARNGRATAHAAVAAAARNRLSATRTYPWVVSGLECPSNCWVDNRSPVAL